jgi:hypothetical protein
MAAASDKSITAKSYRKTERALVFLSSRFSPDCLSDCDQWGWGCLPIAVSEILAFSLRVFFLARLCARLSLFGTLFGCSLPL